MKLKSALCKTVMLLLGSTAVLAGQELLINGAGATFPYPLYSKWFSEYAKLHPDLHFNYQSIGSGGGIAQVTKGTVDFGASDAPMTAEEMAKAPDIIHIPTVLGAVVVVFNVPGVTALNLTGESVAAIFLGRITRWNDPALRKDNPKTALPDLPLVVAHRSDGSGTSAVFTDYLSKVSPDWKKDVGAGKSVKWPTGLGGKGNEGVSGLVKQTQGGVGYVELAYATQNQMNMAALGNTENEFIKPTVDAITKAAAAVVLPEDFRVSITAATGKGAYPVSAFTYLLIHANSSDDARGSALADFLWWAIHRGQALAAPLDYAPLPAPVVTRVEARIKTLKVHGKPALAVP